MVECSTLPFPFLFAEIFGLSVRVTPETGAPVEASSATAAWRAVLQRHGLAKRAAGLSGQRMFGLDAPTVAKLVQSLPHAARCSAFEAWTRDKPEAVPMVRPQCQHPLLSAILQLCLCTSL